jgi:D-3-phosphoglycerate dehydrogenase / 2-oxoglutarate reductase
VQVGGSPGPGSRFRVLSAARLEGPELAELRAVARLDLVGAAVGAVPPGAAELMELVPRYDVLLVESEPITEAVLRANPRLSAVGCCRGDPVNIDLATATELGIPILYAPGRNAEATADYAMGLLISQVRNIARAHHLLVGGKMTVPRALVAERSERDTIWRLPDGRIPGRWMGGPELRDLVLGIVGLGRIGRAVARRAAAFGMTVIGCDPYVTVAPDAIPLLSLNALLDQSDIISLHCKLTPETERLIGRAEIARMKPGAVLINTARARIVDEEALLDGLRDGHLGGAGLDVFLDEPLPDDSPFLGLENVTITPHLAGASSSVVRRHTEMVVGDVLRLVRGEPPMNLYAPAHPGATGPAGDPVSGQVR